MVIEGAAGPGVTSDPSQRGGGARDYEVERGTDVHGYWYKSPGDKGSGDPGRPEDPAEYIGMKPPSGSESTGEEAPAAAPATEGVKRRRVGV